MQLPTATVVLLLATIGLTVAVPLGSLPARQDKEKAEEKSTADLLSSFDLLIFY